MSERLTMRLCGFAHGLEGKTVDEALKTRPRTYGRGEFDATACVDRLCEIEEILLDENGEWILPLDLLRTIAEAERMIGKIVYRITTPYRGVPKVTPYIVKNYRTTGKKHKIMLEVCAVGVGVMNIMSLKQFYLTRESAEAALSAGKEVEG